MNKPLPRRITAFVYGVAALFLGAVLSIDALTMWQTYQRAIAESEVVAKRFVGASVGARNRRLVGVGMVVAAGRSVVAQSRQTRLVLLGTGGGPRPPTANSASPHVIDRNGVA